MMQNRIQISPLAVAEIMSQIVRITSGPSFTTGLNPAQWAALRYLSGVGPHLRNVTAFSRYHGTSKGTASQTIAALTRKGLVVRRGAPDDRRVVIFELTEAGQEALQHDPIRLVARAVEALPLDEQRNLSELLEKLMRSALAAR